jgi:hypothetical protein
LAKSIPKLLEKAKIECPPPYESQRHGKRYRLKRSKARNLFERLRDFEQGVRLMEVAAVHQDKPYHMGIHGHVSRSSLADVNERRDWRIYADLGQALIHSALSLYAVEDLEL